MSPARILRSATDSATGMSHGQVVMMPDGAMLSMSEAPFASDLARGVQTLMRSVGPLAWNATESKLVNDTRYVEKEIVLFWDAPRFEWIVLGVAVVTLVILDNVIANTLRARNVSSYKAHATMVICWILCGLGYNLYYGMRHGMQDGVDWFVGYALEWMLSLDNLFAFQLIVKSYAAPEAIQHKALFFGVLGTLITRLLLFCAIGTLMHSINIVQFLFGIILIYAGVQTLHEDDTERHPDELFFVQLLKKCLGRRLRDSYDTENHCLFVWDPDDGRLCATLLVPLILCIEVTDVIFAVDSVSAKVAQIPNQYIAYSSSVLALLGLRAMYFVIDDLVKYFGSLKYGVCFILVFIGGELMISGKFQLPDWIVCVVIITVFNLCIVFSLLQKVICDSSSDRPAGTPSEGILAGTPSGVLCPEMPQSLPLPKKDGQTEELREKLLQRLAASEGGIGSPQRERSLQTRWSASSHRGTIGGGSETPASQVSEALSPVKASPDDAAG